jgi:hypothetical protein
MDDNREEVFKKYSCFYCGRFRGYNNYELGCSISCRLNIVDIKPPLPEKERLKNFNRSYDYTLNRNKKRVDELRKKKDINKDESNRTD